MSTLIHVVHPYTYKLVGNELILGQIPEFEERDRSIGTFLREALDARVALLHYSDHPFTTVRGTLLQVVFELDSNYISLLDPRVDFVVTTHYGTPIPDEKPLKLTNLQWKNLRAIYTSHSDLQKKIGKPSVHLFFGGLVEACLTNTLGYHLEHFHEKGARLCYVPAFSVSFSAPDRKRMERQVENLGIETLSSQDALDLIHAA
ncbi:MAG: hypothetical protein Q8L34_04760 [Candidatus Woesearchaeota archaeon]|nr:hypothetical protein [Candidatus Woesearchaeota archaeon]